jgi:hypothetical protein
VTDAQIIKALRRELVSIERPGTVRSLDGHSITMATRQATGFGFRIYRDRHGYWYYEPHGWRDTKPPHPPGDGRYSMPFLTGPDALAAAAIESMSSSPRRHEPGPIRKVTVAL